MTATPPMVPRASRAWSAKPRARGGSALVLVLVMTLSLAGLAISAVLLTSSSALVQRFYDKDKDYRFAAQAALELVKATVQRDTTVTIPTDTAYRALTAASITDAQDTITPFLRINGYAAYTGDTAGTHIPFLTIMSQAYDTLGTRSVQRRDLRSESFSRYAFFVDSFASNVAIQLGQHIHGRVHGNRNWVSTSTSPGPDYYDTVTVVGSTSGVANYHGITAVTAAKRIKWPTTSSPDITRLATLATAGNLSITPVTGTSIAKCNVTPVINLSGQDPSTVTGCWNGWGYSGFFSWRYVARGTRLRFRPVDVNANGAYEDSEGFFEVFELAAGMDTSSLRADIPRTNPGSITNIVTLNQCGLMTTIAGRKEFFPVARFRELWVRARVRSSTAPTVSVADTAVMGAGDATAVSKILSYGQGYSRCFPAGSPWLMLTERYVTAPSCTITTNTGIAPYGWGATGTGCSQYGGQDTTFTPNVTRCHMGGTTGLCDYYQVSLGSWRTFASGGGTSTVPALTAIQDAERPYLWPLSSTYNSASRGVVAATTGPLFVSDTVRGYATLYVDGAAVLIDDIVYDQVPTDSAALCRNFFGLISSSNTKIAQNSLNYPRADPLGTVRYFGSPNFTFNGVVLSMGSFAVEDSTYALAGGTILCNGTSTAGGCLNATGGIIAKVYHPTHQATAGTGIVLNLTPDPCQDQSTNRRPPFFPLTGKYVDYKSYEPDTRETDTWAEIKTYLARLRGNNRKVP